MSTGMKKASGIISVSVSLFFILALSLFLAPSCGARHYSSNGETIYYTGYNDQNERIPFEGGPMWLYMHGGGCVECHGPGGRGGRPIMMLREAPADIRYESLISGRYETGGEAQTPYTDQLIIRAIREGLDADGEPIDRGMPRWQMAERDVRDTIEYLKQLK